MKQTAAAGPWKLIAMICIGLMLILLGDVWGAHQADLNTSVMVQKSFQSITLVDDLRWQIHLIDAADPKDPAINEVIWPAIEKDIAAYAPLATFADEAQVWARLRDSLTLLRHAIAVGDVAEFRQLRRGVTALVEKLTDINVRSAESLRARLGHLRTREIWIDTIVVLLVVLWVVWLGWRFARSLHLAEVLAKENTALVERRNQALQSFAGAAAHDLRAPLNPIRGYAELIATASGADAESRRLAGFIGKAVGRMTHVIDDMLELATADHVQEGSSNLREAFAQAVHDLGPDLEGSDVVNNADQTEFACDGVAMNQLLNNLVSNAFKYRSPKRTLRVELCMGEKVVTKGTELVEFIVRDNGIGMDEQSCKRAFDPFFRARRDIAGTGLGLAIVERIVRAHGGTCEVRSGVDEGTSVHVWLRRS